MIINSLLNIAAPGTIIPKPKAKKDFIVKGIGIRRNEKALIYLIPNHKNPEKPHEKGITFSEFEKAYKNLIASGEFTHEWFNKNLSKCSQEGSCNYTTIGGLFELLKISKYSGLGIYIRI